MSRWAPKPQCCHRPGRGPAGTQRQAGATHPGTQLPALPAAPEGGAQGLLAQLPVGDRQEVRAGKGRLTVLPQPLLPSAAFLLSFPSLLLHNNSNNNITRWWFRARWTGLKSQAPPLISCVILGKLPLWALVSHLSNEDNYGT